MAKFFSTIILVLVLLGFSRAAEPHQRLIETAKSFEVKALPEPPPWATTAAPALFQVGWLTDLHITSEESLALVKAACNKLRDELKPEVTFITGDNCGLPEKLLPLSSDKNIPLRRQKWLQEFLEQELARPYIIIPGDNWPGEFESVFGSDKQSFAFAGFQFIFASLDNQASGKEGCLTFTEQSWQWLEKEFQQNAAMPCIFILHEPVYPPGFLEAPRLARLFAAHPQMLLALGGHLHLDLEFCRQSWTQWCGPALGRSHRPAFKWLSFYPQRIVMNSYEWQESSKQFLSVCKWQQVEVPEHLQPKQAPKDTFQPEKHYLYPPKPRQEVPALGQRQAEYSRLTLQFILELGLETFFQKTTD